MAGLRLKLYRMARIHRGEERRTVGFALIYLMISMITGLLSSGADVLFLRHRTTGAEIRIIEALQSFQRLLSGQDSGILAGTGNVNSVLVPPLLGFGALLLIAVGIVYTGWTDRRNKQKVFLGGMVAGLLLSMAVVLLFLFPELQRVFPLFYSFLYILRFAGGVFLLMVFWDLTGLYFDIRQGKRLYPLLAMSGVAGYTAGTLLVTPILIYAQPALLFLLIGALNVGSYALFVWMRRYVRPLWNSRNRAEGFRETLRQGYEYFKENRFLQVLSASTLLFGIAAGLIMFSFNSVVTEFVDSSRMTAEYISFQRAAASILEAVIVTKVLSQSAMGGQMRSNFLVQVGILFLGFVAFLVSMVGVADFTRQIAIALMSPAAMASFAIIPSEYRGRSMSAINLVVAPTGMALASIAVILLDSFFRMRIFIVLIAVFLIARLVMNLWVNRAYVNTLTSDADRSGDFDAASLFEEAGSLLQDEQALAVWMKRLEEQDEPVKLLIWGRFAEHVRTKVELNRLRPYAPPLAGRRGALWLRLLADFEPESARRHVELLAGEEHDDENDEEIRKESLRIVRNRLEERDILRQEYLERRRAILAYLNGGTSEAADGTTPGRTHQDKPDGQDEPATGPPVPLSLRKDTAILALELENGDEETIETLRNWWSRKYSPSRGSESPNKEPGDTTGESDVTEGILTLMLGHPRKEFEGIYYELLQESEHRPKALSALEALDSLNTSLWEKAYRNRDDVSLGLSLQDLLQRHLRPDLLKWFWGLLEEELSGFLERDELLYRDLSRREEFLLLEGLYKIALNVQEDMPPRIKLRNGELIDRVIRYKGEILSMDTRSFPADYPYEALYRRWIRHFDAILLRLLLLAAGFGFTDFEQRHRYSLLVQDLQPNVPSVRTKILELLELTLDKREQRAFSLFLEPLTLEEKLLRLRSVLAHPESGWQGFFDYWRNRREEIPFGTWKGRLVEASLSAAPG